MKYVDAVSRHLLPVCNLVERQLGGILTQIKKAQSENRSIKKILDLVQFGKTKEYEVRDGLLYREH